MPKKAIKRSDDIKGRIEDEDLVDLYTSVTKGFEAQRDRSEEILDNWDIYNCILLDKQFYNGTSQLAMPFVHDAVEARVTRFTNQIFPLSGRYVEVTTGEPDPPQATQALIESYIRQGKFRTQIVPPLIRNGDVEGQYSIYVDWVERKRRAQFRTMKQPTTDGRPNPAAEPVADIKEEVIVDARPDVEVISDPDLLVLPATADSIEQALWDDGGSVTVIRRWTKGKIRRLIADEEIDKERGENLITEMNKQRDSKDYDVAKENLNAAGIKERGKFALVFETWSYMKVRGQDERRLSRLYFGGEGVDNVLSVKPNPYWHDRCPVISAPVIKVKGSFKGQAPISVVADLLILANDTINEAADTAHFSAMPIVMTDPLKNSRYETMVLALAAIWETNPNDTEIVEFPELWKDGLERCLSIRDQIFQTLGVNPAMLPYQTGGSQRKRNQAEVAMEQQVDLLTTADSVTIVEEGVLSPAAQMFAELDHQYRDKETTVRVYGQMGEDANMQDVDPLQLTKRFEFRWFGVESARNAQLMQAKISWLNVVKGIPPTMFPDYEIDFAPMIMQGTEDVFGPRTAPLIFHRKKLISSDPMQENDMLLHGFLPNVHPFDHDDMHIVAHMAVLQEAGDDPIVKANTETHIAAHQTAMQQKAMGQAQQMQAPGGGGGGGGGGPRPGGSPVPPRQNKQPAGATHPDQQSRAGGVVAMPRKTA